MQPQHVSVFSGVAVGLAASQRLQENLLKNPSAETSAIEHWTEDSGVWSRGVYSGPPNPSNNYFFNGMAEGLNSQHQWIDFTAQGPEIDLYQRYFGMMGWFGGHNNATDTGVVRFECFGEKKKKEPIESATLLGAITIGPYTKDDRQSLTSYQSEVAYWAPPPGTRHVKVTMEHNSVTNFTLIDQLNFQVFERKNWMYENLVGNPDCEWCAASCWWNAIEGSKQLSKARWVEVGLTPVLPDNIMPRLFLGGVGPASESPYQQSQFIEVGAEGEGIDLGQRGVYASALLGGQGDNEDSAVVQLEEYDETGLIKTGSGEVYTLGPVTKEDREGKTTFMHRERLWTLSSGTRRIKVTMQSMRPASDGPDRLTTGFLDDISVILVKAPLKPTGCNTATVLWLAIDVSRGISTPEMYTMVQQYRSALLAAIPPHFGNIAIGASAFAMMSIRIFEVQLIKDQMDLNRLLGTIDRLSIDRAGVGYGYEQNVGFALEDSMAALKSPSHEFTECENMVVDLSTSGSSVIGPHPQHVAHFLVKSHVKVNCLGIGSLADCRFATLNGGQAFRPPTFQDIDSFLVSKLNAEMASVAPTPQPTPLPSGATRMPTPEPTPVPPTPPPTPRPPQAGFETKPKSHGGQVQVDEDSLGRGGSTDGEQSFPQSLLSLICMALLVCGPVTLFMMWKKHDNNGKPLSTGDEMVNQMFVPGEGMLPDPEDEVYGNQRDEDRDEEEEEAEENGRTDEPQSPGSPLSPTMDDQPVGLLNFPEPARNRVRRKSAMAPRRSLVDAAPEAPQVEASDGAAAQEQPTATEDAAAEDAAVEEQADNKDGAEEQEVYHYDSNQQAHAGGEEEVEA